MHPTASSEEHFNQQIKISVRLHHYKEVLSIMKRKKGLRRLCRKTRWHHANFGSRELMFQFRVFNSTTYVMMHCSFIENIHAYKNVKMLKNIMKGNISTWMHYSVCRPGITERWGFIIRTLIKLRQELLY